jgi:hypothetical protein
VSVVEAAFEYRAYRIGDDGLIVQANQFVAAADEVAVEKARQFVNGWDVELWSGGRLVARLIKQTPTQPPVERGDCLAQTRYMKDFHIQLEKLQVEAEDCALISKLASNVAKRVAFARLADQFRTMAANMELRIAVRPNET